jgi:hypothetical protein
MRASVGTVLIALGFAAVASAQVLPPSNLPEQRLNGLCGIKADTAAGFRAAMVGEWKMLTVADPSRYEAFANEQRLSILSFTKLGHPAHPAAVCRDIGPNANGGSTIIMTVQGEASKSACDQLVRDFAALNNAFPK